MNHRWCAVLFLSLLSWDAPGQVISTPDTNGPLGDRPYEMVWASRTEPGPPTIRFDDLTGWTIKLENGAEATLQVTTAQNVWDRPVARLKYRGTGKADPGPRIVIHPPQPITLTEGGDAIDVWAYGNRWDWEHPPGTPPVRILINLRDARDESHQVHLDNIRWQEWWLMHKKLASCWPQPLRFESIEANGGFQSEWREIFFDSLRFYRESLPPIRFAARPKRNLALPEGQDPGANKGPGRLPFPTTEKTILPQHFSGRYANRVRHLGNAVYRLSYSGKDCQVDYLFEPRSGLSGVTAQVDGQPAGRLLDGATVRFVSSMGTPRDETGPGELVICSERGGAILAEYRDGTTLSLRIWQKSLVLDVVNRSGRASELKFGSVSAVAEPRIVSVPYLTYGGGPRPCVLLSRTGTNKVFTSIWLDWYRSNGSEPYAAESASTNSARINGGVRYHTRTDGVRNPMFERLFVTVSPRFEEVLPTVANPVGLHAKEACDRLWQESWGPDNFEKQMKRSRMLRAYGIEKLIQCNHEIAWRDGGESFTLRTRAAPKKGGDPALKQYVAHQRGLGWLAGLYSNYTDYSPVNEFWTPDGVQRLSDGNWRSAWPRCWAEKPLKAVEFDAVLAPQIKAKFKPNSAYTDVHTAVGPWAYNDYDARVPGAATFAQTFYAYGELLRNDSRVYDGPIFSEGYYHWLYAGLADGNYALMYDNRPLAKEPLLPVFDLYQIHTRECDIGMAWTAHFCDGIPDWRKPENLDNAIDRFLLHTLAYGHIGWLVEEDHGIARTCRSYYMLQQVQSRYGLKAPLQIGYWDGTRLATTSEAIVRELPRTRRQFFVEYPGGLQLWLNDHPSEKWPISMPDFRCDPKSAKQTRTIDVPPAGWAAFTKDGKLVSFSALDGTNRVDHVRSPEYVFLDGRGKSFQTPEAETEGSLVIRPIGKRQLEVIVISGSAPFSIGRPFKTSGLCVSCQAFDVDGSRLPDPAFNNRENRTRITPGEKALRYLLSFSST